MISGLSGSRWGKLDPYAAKGAVTLDALREEIPRAGARRLRSAIDKAAGAIMVGTMPMAGVQGFLVSVRPLHGSGAADDFTNAEAALMGPAICRRRSHRR